MDNKPAHKIVKIVTINEEQIMPEFQDMDKIINILQKYNHKLCQMGMTIKDKNIDITNNFIKINNNHQELLKRIKSMLEIDYGDIEKNKQCEQCEQYEQYKTLLSKLCEIIYRNQKKICEINNICGAYTDNDFLVNYIEIIYMITLKLNNLSSINKTYNKKWVYWCIISVCLLLLIISGIIIAFILIIMK